MPLRTMGFGSQIFLTISYVRYWRNVSFYMSCEVYRKGIPVQDNAVARYLIENFLSVNSRNFIIGSHTFFPITVILGIWPVFQFELKYSDQCHSQHRCRDFLHPLRGVRLDDFLEMVIRKHNLHNHFTRLAYLNLSHDSHKIRSLIMQHI